MSRRVEVSTREASDPPDEHLKPATNGIGAQANTTRCNIGTGRLPVWGHLQTSQEQVPGSAKGHFRTHALQQIATMFDAFTCRCTNYHSTNHCRSRQIARSTELSNVQIGRCLFV
jgi:hypothetical protein